MDPQQELFTELLLKLKEKWGDDVYDGFLPPEGTSYPFIYLADSNQIDDANKSAVFGNVYQNIHVYSNNPKKRGELSTILLEIKKICRNIEHTENFAWHVRNISQRILPDKTIKQPLLHGILEVEFKFS